MKSAVDAICSAFHYTNLLAKRGTVDDSNIRVFIIQRVSALRWLHDIDAEWAVREQHWNRRRAIVQAIATSGNAFHSNLIAALKQARTRHQSSPQTRGDQLQARES
jgi:hypothetical protein